MRKLINGTILVPVDFSDESLDALTVASDLADDMMVVHVVPDHEGNEHDLLAKAIDHAKRRDNVKEVLQAYIKDALSDSATVSSDIDVRFGDPGSEIAAAADRRDVKLIVMPSHGRTGIERLLLGSVAERVLRLAACPVLILRD